MAFYRTDRVTSRHRDAVRRLLRGLEGVPKLSAERIVEAWAILWSSGTFEDLLAASVSPGLRYTLVDHTNDVVRIGRAMAAAFRERMNFTIDMEAMDEILFLHDIDKLLLFRPSAAGVELTELAGQMPHGVVAGILLSEMGFSEKVISIVSTHATNAPFHVASPEGLLMYYADMAAIDLVHIQKGGIPFYVAVK